ncbi:MAG: oligosaccharide flippase family protein [Bacteroidota bacterium]
MKKLRELLSDSLMYGISSVLARFLNYLLVPFHTDVFEPGRYGIIGLLYAAIAFLNILFTFGMESTFLRFAKDREIAASYFKTIQLLVFGAVISLSGLLWILRSVWLPYLGLSAGMEYLFAMMLGILVMDALSAVPFAELRLIRKSGFFALLKVGHVVINLVLNFYLILVLDWGIEAVLFSNLMASIMVAAILNIWAYHLWKGQFNSPMVRQALRFGLPLIPAGIGYTINEFVDRFFLGNMDPQTVEILYGAGATPESVVGIYNACYKLAVFMLLLVQMFRMAWQPFFFRHAEDEDAPQLFANTFLLFNAVAAVLFVGTALFADYIVQIPIPLLHTTLIDQAYWSGLEIVPYLLLAYWFLGCYINLTVGPYLTDKTEMLSTFSMGGAALTILGNILLVPVWGMIGAAVATVLCYGGMAAFIWTWNRKYYPVPYKMWKVTILFIGAITVVFGIQYLDSNPSMYLRIMGVFVIISLIGILGFSTIQSFLKSRISKKY